MYIYHIHCSPLPLFVVDTGKITVDYSMIGTEAQCTKVGGHGSVKYPSLFQHVAQVNVSILKSWVQLYCLFKCKGRI